MLILQQLFGSVQHTVVGVAAVYSVEDICLLLGREGQSSSCRRPSSSTVGLPGACNVILGAKKKYTALSGN